MAAKRGGDLTPAQLREVWVRAGGRCCICGRYLLHGDLAGASTPLGQGAHILPSGDGGKAPRWRAKKIPGLDSSSPENVLLLCFDHHQQVDRQPEIFTTEVLLEIKRSFEQQIHHLTGSVSSNRTTVLEIFSSVQSHTGALRKADSVRAVLARGARTPVFPESVGERGFRFDLSNYPIEDPPKAGHYAAVQEKLDEIADQVKHAISNGQITHLSVFALLRLPLLIYLGLLLDDLGHVETYQLHRSPKGWNWPDRETETTFSYDVPAEAETKTEALLVLSVSGSPSLGQIPEECSALPIVKFRAKAPKDRHAQDVIGAPGDLELFKTSCGSMLSEIEAKMPGVNTLHVVAALPNSAAIELGRAINRDKFPRVVIYHLAEASYEPAIEV